MGTSLDGRTDGNPERTSMTVGIPVRAGTAATAENTTSARFRER
jgi:hypothetical protein